MTLFEENSIVLYDVLLEEALTAGLLSHLLAAFRVQWNLAGLAFVAFKLGTIADQFRTHKTPHRLLPHLTPVLVILEVLEGIQVELGEKNRLPHSLAKTKQNKNKQVRGCSLVGVLDCMLAVTHRRTHIHTHTPTHRQTDTHNTYIGVASERTVHTCQSSFALFAAFLFVDKVGHFQNFCSGLLKSREISMLFRGLLDQIFQQHTYIKEEETEHAEEKEEGEKEVKEANGRSQNTSIE
jgi:hypothetical protein